MRDNSLYIDSPPSPARPLPFDIPIHRFAAPNGSSPAHLPGLSAQPGPTCRRAGFPRPRPLAPARPPTFAIPIHRFAAPNVPPPAPPPGLSAQPGPACRRGGVSPPASPAPFVPSSLRPHASPSVRHSDTQIRRTERPRTALRPSRRLSRRFRPPGPALPAAPASSRPRGAPPARTPPPAA